MILLTLFNSRRLLTTNYSLPTNEGFTLIEVVIATFVIGTVVVGMFGFFLATLRGAQTGERRVVAIALANERMEMVRNLPYVSVGTVGGVPSGAIPQAETVIRNGQTYTVRTDIRYVDDPYDGSAIGPGGTNEEKITICHKPGTPAEQTLTVPAAALDAHLAHGDTTGACGSQGEGTPAGDEYNADYKQVRVAVSWPSRYELAPVLLITYVAPQGIEGGELGGTLDFHALDANGDAVEGATFILVNDKVNPPISITTQTNAEGRAVLPGLPAANDSYAVSVTKDGYTKEQTYDTTATFIPLPDYSPFSILVKQVTPKTFFIDRTATLALATQDESKKKVKNVAYRLRGTKSIGSDDDGNSVFKVDEVAQTDNKGEGSHGGLEWDAYDFTIDGVATGFDVKETSLLLPVVLNPAQSLTMTVTLVPHTPQSLHVTAVDDAGAPIDNATVILTGHGVNNTHITGPPGQAFFADLPVAGTYQLDFDAPGFVPHQQSVHVTGTTRVKVPLSSIP